MMLSSCLIVQLCACSTRHLVQFAATAVEVDGTQKLPKQAALPLEFMNSVWWIRSRWSALLTVQPSLRNLLLFRLLLCNYVESESFPL